MCRRFGIWKGWFLRRVQEATTDSTHSRTGKPGPHWLADNAFTSTPPQLDHQTGVWKVTGSKLVVFYKALLVID